MKQVTINVPDNKLNFFIELISSLGFTKAESKEAVDKSTVPEWQKKIVRERVKKFKKNPQKVFSQKEVDKKIKLG